MKPVKACGAEVAVLIHTEDCMFTTLQEMKHHIRTIFGDSTTIFDSMEDLHAVPLNQEITQTKAEEVILQGIGQGNGAGPQIWAVVSSPILEMLRTAGFVCSFKSQFQEKKSPSWDMHSSTTQI